jgi:hypothetical protein
MAPQHKMVELLQLIQLARDTWMALPPQPTAFDAWWEFHQRFGRIETVRRAVPLCATFAAALVERALIDAVCRLNGLSFFQMLRSGRLGFQPARIHPQLPDDAAARGGLPDSPLEKIHVRHTVGLTDWIGDEELNDSNRIGDGLPQSLQQYVAAHGLRYFKIKICGKPQDDLARLERIWRVIRGGDPQITLDGNESFGDAAQLNDFIAEFRSSLPEMFRRVLFVEQPLGRGATLDTSGAEAIREIARDIPLIIDEADGDLHSFRDAAAIGYTGVSHKNCKGIFKSLANLAWCAHRNRQGAGLFLSAEDLTNLPIVALNQDLTVVAALGLAHAERNGHHYFAGLSHLTPAEQQSARRDYGGLYADAAGRIGLNIRDGAVDVSGLQCPGLGLARAPAWDSMTPLESWLAELR